MTKLSNVNIPASTVITIIVGAATVLGNYYASREAFHDAINDLKTETRIDIGALKSQDKIHDLQIAQLHDAVKAATTYIGTGAKPQ